MLELAEFDVVLENLSPHRAKRIGVDPQNVAATGKDTLLLSSSGFGHTGKWSGYRAYGHNLHAFAGVVEASRDGHGNIGDIGTPWADPLTSVALVTWALAWSLAPRQDSFSFDISMSELVAAQISELLHSDADPFEAREQGDDFFLVIPNNDRLLAVSFANEAQRTRFAQVTGIEIPKQIRKNAMVRIDPTDLPEAQQSDVMERLLEASIAASWVYTSPELARDPFIRSTGLFRSVESTTLGSYEVTGMPWVEVERDQPQLDAAPEITERILV